MLYILTATIKVSCQQQCSMQCNSNNKLHCFK